MTSLAEWGIIAGRAVLIWAIQLSFLPLLIWFERKASAYIQDRTGPNRAAILGIRMGGIVHAIADVVKLVFKEDVVPSGARRFYYFFAPFAAMMVALMTFAVIPFADTLHLGGREIPMQVLRINPGLLWVFAVASFGVFGIVFAGWGANSKYPLLGGIRSSAQLVSYELSLSLSVMGLLMIFGTLDLNRIVQGQGKLLFGFLPMWGILVQPLAAVLFIVAALAETNRIPFDLPDADSEIVGYHIEYSSMKFALFFMAEYVNIVVASGLITTLFFGGWQIPWLPTGTLIHHAQAVVLVVLGLLVLLSGVLLPAARRWSRRLKRLYADARRHEADFWTAVLAGQAALALALAGWFWTHPLGVTGATVAAAVLQFATFLIKVTIFGFAFIWIRWTLPRFRYDQLMRLGWKGMLPLALLNILVTGAVVLLVGKP
jgi:NADH-quinone oxidoreductase subunit H